MRNLVIALLASSAAATLAIAAPAQAQGFNGARVEVRGGWDSVRLDGEFERATPPLSVDGHNSESGFSFGAEAGYDVNVGSSFLIGGYAGANFSSADFCTTVFNADTACLEAGRDLYIGVRAGMPVAQTFLIYLKGGYSHGKLKANFDDADGFVTVSPPIFPPVPIGDFDDSKHAEESTSASARKCHSPKRFSARSNWSAPTTAMPISMPRTFTSASMQNAPRSSSAPA